MEEDAGRLPGGDRVVVEAAKLRDYLLSHSHPIGRFKATFFLALGYSPEAWEILAGDLRRHALECDATPTESTAYGQKYEIRGILTGPTGRTAGLISVWIIPKGEDSPDS